MLVKLALGDIRTGAFSLTRRHKRQKAENPLPVKMADEGGEPAAPTLILRPLALSGFYPLYPGNNARVGCERNDISFCQLARADEGAGSIGYVSEGARLKSRLLIQDAE